MNNKIKILILKVHSNEELIKIQQIGIENDFYWPTGGKTIVYRDIYIYEDSTIHFIVFDLKGKRMTYRNKIDYLNDTQYIDTDTETTPDERLIINNITELEHFIKYGRLPINYNKPRQLVYESTNYEDDIYEICIKIEDEKELTELEEIHKKYMGDNQYFQPYHTDENGLDEDGEIFRPLYIFVNFRYKTGISCISESEDIFDIENGGLTEDESFNDVYKKKVFIFKKDKNKITNILIHKNINYVSYNEPRQLVYENKINKFNNFKK